MTKGHKPFDLDEAIRRSRRIWHQREAINRHLLREADRRAKGHPRDGTLYLLTKVARMGDHIRGRLLTKFGYLVPRVTAARGPLLARDRGVNGRVVELSLFPGNPERSQEFAVLYVEWNIWALAFAFMLPSSEHQYLLSDEEKFDAEEEFEFVRREFVRMLSRLPGLCMSEVMLGKSRSEELVDIEAVGQQEIAWVAGWAYSKISLQRNKRLRDSLKEMGDSPDSVLRQELPGATLDALEKINQEDGGRVDKLVSHITGDLEGMGQRPLSAGKLAELAALNQPDSSPEDPLQEFLAKEELDALIASANLAERECQIVELKLKGLRQREIADELKITEGTVKSTMSRVRRKLRQAAGQ